MSNNVILKGKAVYFTYSITTDADGSVVEQSDIPVGYVHGGYSNLVEKVEAALEGCKVGDAVEVPVSAAENFWEYDPDLTFTDDIGNVPEQFRRVGAQVEMVNDDGETKVFFVTEIKNGKLTVDGNHPLAGKAITFHVMVRSIRPATTEELQSGAPDDSWSEDVLH